MMGFILPFVYFYLFFIFSLRRCFERKAKPQWLIEEYEFIFIYFYIFALGKPQHFLSYPGHGDDRWFWVLETGLRNLSRGNV